MRSFVLLLLLSAAPALASSNYPVEIKNHLMGSSVPDCSVCHKNNVTGPGTVTTLMGNALRANGLVSSDLVSLRSSLDALQAAGTDSDLDGATDVEELKVGTNPNVAEAGADGGTGGSGGGGSGDLVLSPPRYGCGAMAAPGFLGLSSLVLLLGLRRRR